MVQIPASFNAGGACIVTATSSGSRGVYGAIGSAGEWGLKRGCVVAYTDKGTGTGVHDLATDTVNLQNGVRTGAAAAGKNSNFTADADRRRARRVQRGHAQPRRGQARAFAAEPGEGLGPRHAERRSASRSTC